MRRLAVSALLPLLVLLVLGLPVGAAVRWCKSDPVVRLDGTQVQILVGVPDEYVPLVNGPVNVEIATPKEVVRELVLTDSGYNGHGETVRFTDLSSYVRVNKTFTTQIRTRVPIDKSRLLPGEVVLVEVTVIPDNAPAVVVTGTSDDTKVLLSITGR